MSILTSEIGAALLIAAGVAAGQVCGWRIAVAMSLGWTLLLRVSTGAGGWTGLPALGVAIGLILWTDWLNRRLQAEHRLARRDALTGIANRQAFLEQFRAELSRAGRFCRPLTLALLDGDNFKTLNDRQGHAAGDQALQATARTLSESVRHYDFVARLGGDEFVVLFPETGPTAAEAAVGRLQQSLKTALESAFAPLTYCIGVVTLLPGPHDSAASLSAADRALYLAKRIAPGTVRFETMEPKSKDRRE